MPTHEVEQGGPESHEGSSGGEAVGNLRKSWFCWYWAIHTSHQSHCVAPSPALGSILTITTVFSGEEAECHIESQRGLPPVHQHRLCGLQGRGEGSGLAQRAGAGCAGAGEGGEAQSGRGAQGSC